MLDPSVAYHAYQAALKHWNQCQTWRENDGPARAELEHRYSYDTEHAMHLLRLPKMGAEILETERVRVYRPDREWLAAVRNGLLSNEVLLELATASEATLGELYDHSSLPEEPDFEAAEASAVQLQGRILWEAQRER